MIPATYPLYEKRAEHQRVINGSRICYETVCRDIPVQGDDGTLLGTAFAYEYIRTDCEEKMARPVLFAYNGGPGASAVWLHSGLLAPVRFAVEDIVHPEFQGKARLEENPCCLLDQCDIVLLDPPGVGYGTLAEASYGEKVFGYEQDARCVAQVIEKWLIEQDRLHSPIYLLGESYGTVRNCLVADILTGGPFIPGMMSKAIPVAGIIMLGSAVNYHPAMLLFGEQEVSSTALAIPTMAAIHWYHSPEKEETLEQRLSRAYRFVSEKYVRAVYLGNRMEQEEREALAEEMSRLTGMPVSYIRNHNLTLESGDFQKMLLEEEGRIVSAYDGRMSLAYIEGKLDAYADDAVLGPYGYLARNAFDQICREEFQMELKRPFSSVDFAVNGVWDYKGAATPFESLSRCLRRNGNLKVLFGNGVYDLTTMIGQAAYSAAQLTAARPGQVQIKEYPSGHMAYIGKESANMLNGDLRAFIKESTLQ